MAGKDVKTRSGTEESMFWADQLAREVVEKERQLNRGIKTFRTEMGLGASGVPHVGSAGDGVRSFAVSLALKDLGLSSELIAFSDDRDGLRKVPAGFPSSMEKDIGKPVSEIIDPFGCHKSFGLHVSGLLTDSFDKIGVRFKLLRGHEEYNKGTLDREIVEILANASKCGEIIKKITGQDKYLKQLPFLPICSKCGRIYTTNAYEFDSKTKKVKYRCDQEFEGKNSTTGKTIAIKGCGYEGEADIREGKLAWKVEFAARWRALRISFEAYGKDILDSVKCNDEIARQVLKWEPPVHAFYEMFTERGGRKIAKSAGNVFTPQMWLRYASPESLRLLFLKRLGTTRVVDLDAIPSYMDEVDEMTDVYFKKPGTMSDRDYSHQKRLFEYLHFLKPPKGEGFSIDYNVLLNMSRIAKDKKVVKDMLKRTGHITEKLPKTVESELDSRLGYVESWLKDSGVAEEKIKLSQKQKDVLKKLAKELEGRKFDEKGLTDRIYEIIKEENVPAKDFFSGAYAALLNSSRGPRLVPLILAIGQKKAAELLKKD